MSDYTYTTGVLAIVSKVMTLFVVYLVYMLTIVSFKAMIGINVAFGTILAEISQSSTVENLSQRWERACAIIPWCLITLGLFVCSFPSENSEWTAWSQGLARWGKMSMPSGGELSRYVHSVGAQLLMLGILFSSAAKHALSNKLMGWMGKTSFAVYLIHPLFIRTILVWGLYGTLVPPEGHDKHGKPTGPSRMTWSGVGISNAAAFPLFYAILYIGAAYWVKYVEPACGLVMQKLETFMLSGKQAQPYDKLLPK